MFIKLTYLTNASIIISKIFIKTFYFIKNILIVNFSKVKSKRSFEIANVYKYPFYKTTYEKIRKESLIIHV